MSNSEVIMILKTNLNNEKSQVIVLKLRNECLS